MIPRDMPLMTSNIHLIGPAGFEPPTSLTPFKRSTKLNYGPLRRILLPFLAVRQTFRLRRMTAVISKFDCVARIGLIICLNAISDARAETDGSVKLDEIAFAFAKEHIKKGQIVADGK